MTPRPQPITARVTRHDRRHAEVKLEYAVEDPTAMRQDVAVDLWFFLPQAAGIGPESYGAGGFYQDLHARTRFMTPLLPLDELARVDGAGSPLAALSMLQLQLPPGPVPKRLRRGIRREARLLVCMYRRSAREVIRTAEDGATPVASAAEELVRASRALVARFRALADSLLAGPLGRGTQDALAFSDEALSVDVEAAALHLLELVEARTGRGNAALAALAAEERAWRCRRGLRSSARPDAGDEEERATFYDQASLLKKYTSQVLYLRGVPHGGMHTLEQVALMVAAGAAMLWTVGLQFATLFWFDVQLGRGVTPQMAVAFTLITVVGYMMKDRIKAWSGRRLAERLPRLLYDRRTELQKEDSGEPLGSVRERVTFTGPGGLPEAVRRLREDLTRSKLALWTGAPVLHYHRQVRLLPRVAVRNFPRLAGLTDILRLDLGPWVRHFDSRQKHVSVLDADGDGRRVRVPNHYLVDLVVRLRPASGPDQLEALRLVLTRRGLEAIRPLTGGTPPSEEDEEVSVVRGSPM